MKAEKPLGAMSEEEFSAYIERWREDWWNNNLGAWYKSYYAPLEFLHFSEEMSAEEVDQILTKLHSLISSGSIKACLDQLAIKICGDLKQYWNELFRLHVERLYPGYSIKTSMRFQNQHFVELREEIQYALESLYSTFPGLAASIEGYLTIKEGSMGRAFEKGMEGGAIGGTIGSILLGPIGFLAGAGIGGWLAGKSAQKELEASWGNFCQHLELFENQYNTTWENIKEIVLNFSLVEEANTWLQQIGEEIEEQKNKKKAESWPIITQATSESSSGLKDKIVWLLLGVIITLLIGLSVLFATGVLHFK